MVDLESYWRLWIHTYTHTYTHSDTFFLYLEIQSDLIVIFKLNSFQNQVNGEDDESDFFRATEAIFVIWFTLEYLIRFMVAPYKVSVSIEFGKSNQKFYSSLYFL